MAEQPASVPAGHTYRKIPVEIEARRFEWETIHEVAEWCGGSIVRTRQVHVDGFTLGGHRRIIIRTLEGDMAAEPGDWIIKGVKGEFYPCKPDIFESTYEPVEARQ